MKKPDSQSYEAPRIEVLELEAEAFMINNQSTEETTPTPWGIIIIDE